MRKYEVNPFSKLVYSASAILMLISCGLMVQIAVSSLSERELFDFLCFLVLSIISLVSFIALIKAILTNYAVGEYSFNSEGVTFYTRVNTFVFRYDECAQIGLRYMKSRASKVYFVYLSKKKIQDENFVFPVSKRKRKKLGLPEYQKEYVMFRYDQEAFSEFLKCVPEKIRDCLIQKEKAYILDSCLTDLDSNQSHRFSDQIIHSADVLNEEPNTRNDERIYQCVSDKSRGYVIGDIWLFAVFSPIYYVLGRFFDPKPTQFTILLSNCFGVVGVLALLIIIYRYLTNPLLGKFSFDDNKIRFYTPIRTIIFSFEECKEISIIQWRRLPIVFVCMSRNGHVSGNDLWLFKRPKWLSKLAHRPLYTTDYILFEYYDQNVLKTLNKYLPERLRIQLKQAEKKQSNESHVSS